MSCAKMGKLILMPFGVWTRVGPKTHVLDGGCTMANTIEPSMCGGNAAFFSNYFDHLLLP